MPPSLKSLPFRNPLVCGDCALEVHLCQCTFWTACAWCHKSPAECCCVENFLKSKTEPKEKDNE